MLSRPGPNHPMLQVCRAHQHDGGSDSRNSALFPRTMQYAGCCNCIPDFSFLPSIYHEHMHTMHVGSVAVEHFMLQRTSAPLKQSVHWVSACRRFLHPLNRHVYPSRLHPAVTCHFSNSAAGSLVPASTCCIAVKQQCSAKVMMLGLRVVGGAYTALHAAGGGCAWSREAASHWCWVPRPVGSPGKGVACGWSRTYGVCHPAALLHHRPDPCLAAGLYMVQTQVRKSYF